MSERSQSSPFEAGLNAQQQYWDAWLSLLRQTTGQADKTTEQPGSVEAMRRWWEAMAPALPNMDSTLFDKIMPQGQTYLAFGEQTLQTLQKLQGSLGGDADWQKTLQQSLDTLRETFFQPFQEQGNAHPGLAAFWGLPLDTWQRVASSLSIFPGDALHAMREQGYRPAGLSEGLGKTLEMPTIGYTREQQEQSQQSGRLWLAYQEAYGNYAQLLQKSSQRALERLQERLAKMAQEGKTVNTVREFYNLWVDCSEETYGEMMRGPEYGQAYGKMINALMRFKHHSQFMVNEALSALNIPNRMELDTTHARLQETRRSIRQLRDRTDFSDSEGLHRLMTGFQEEIKALRQEVQTLKEASAAKSTPKRRTAAKKTSKKNPEE